MAAKAGRDSIGTALRKSVASSGLSGNQLSKKSGVEQTTLARFLRGDDMAISKASKLADYFGLSLMPSAKEVEVIVVEVVSPDVVVAKKRKRK